MRIAVAAAALLFVACTSRPAPCVETVIELQQAPRLGDRLPNLKETCIHTMAASAQLWPSYEAVVDNARYTVGVDEDQVRFIATTDSSFASPEGLRIGDPVAAAVAAAPGSEVVQERGWGYFVELPSGWYAFIDDSPSVHDLNLGTRPLGKDARITMFFMRD